VIHSDLQWLAGCSRFATGFDLTASAGWRTCQRLCKTRHPPAGGCHFPRFRERLSFACRKPASPPSLNTVRTGRVIRTSGKFGGIIFWSR